MIDSTQNMLLILVPEITISNYYNTQFLLMLLHVTKTVTWQNLWIFGKFWFFGDLGFFAIVFGFVCDFFGFL